MSPPLTHELENRTALTSTTTGDAIVFSGAQPKVLQAELDVTAGGTDGTDFLDVTIQTQLKDGSWVDVIAFTQVAGNAADKTHFAKIVADEPQAMFEIGTSLSAGSIRHILGQKYRAVMTVTDGSGTPTFTFTIRLHAIR